MIGCDVRTCRTPTDPRDRGCARRSTLEVEATGPIRRCWSTRGRTCGSRRSRRHHAGGRHPLHARPRRSRAGDRRGAPLQRAQRAPSRCYGDGGTAATCGGCSRTSSTPPTPKGGGIPQLEAARDRRAVRRRRPQVQPVPLLHGSRCRSSAFASGRSPTSPTAAASPTSPGRCSRARRARARRPPRSAAPDALHAVRGGGGGERIGAARTYFTHICHDLPHAATNARLPAGMELAYDGLVLDGRGRRGSGVAFSRRPGRRAGTHPVLALGNFDGLHRGHMKIIERVRRGAAERGGTPVAMTFDPHPPRVLRPDKAPPLLMTRPQKLEALERAGMQGVALVRFTHELSRGIPRRSSARAGGLAARGRGVGRRELPVRPRTGPATSRCCGRSARSYGFRAEKIDPVRYKDFVVSSTRIRRLVAEGRVDEAGALLGHPLLHRRRGRAGRGAGASSGFPRPTSPRPTSCCRRTASTPRLATLDGVVHPASPTSACGRRSATSTVVIETHVLGFDRDLYGRPAAGVRAAPARRAAFPDVDALREQIEADVRGARAALRRISL
jgi:riboflavin kinase / FMN adenylyltransferase